LETVGKGTGDILKSGREIATRLSGGHVAAGTWSGLGLIDMFASASRRSPHWGDHFSP
jgi:hypothetical protein